MLDVCATAVARFGDIGCTVEEADPDLTEVDEVFQTLRAFTFAMSHEAHLRDHRELLKDTVVWNTEQGLALGAMEVAHAEVKRAALFDRMVEFFGRFDYLVCPTTQVPPFSVDTHWVREINGVELETYVDWMAACYAITVTGCPSISVPAGFTPDGLPIGIQIVAPPKCDFEALQLAHAYEGVARFRGAPPAAVIPMQGEERPIDSGRHCRLACSPRRNMSTDSRFIDASRSRVDGSRHDSAKRVDVKFPGSETEDGPRPVTLRARRRSAP